MASEIKRLGFIIEWVWQVEQVLVFSVNIRFTVVQQVNEQCKDQQWTSIKISI
jgi:hypothetical protein